MKAGIHPKYSTNATVTCACGNTFSVGSTTDSISVEICSKCHPFWTGQENTLDAAGRVDRFKKRQAAAKTPAKKSK
jgi:large subunit ribosomal protein L31